MTAIILTHWVRVSHICVSRVTIIGSDNGLPPGWRQAIIWTNAGILLIGPLVKNVSEILIDIYIFLFKKMHLKMSSGKWQPFCLDLIVFFKHTHLDRLSRANVSPKNYTIVPDTRLRLKHQFQNSICVLHGLALFQYYKDNAIDISS